MISDVSMLVFKLLLLVMLLSCFLSIAGYFVSTRYFDKKQGITESDKLLDKRIAYNMAPTFMLRTGRYAMLVAKPKRGTLPSSSPLSLKYYYRPGFEKLIRTRDRVLMFLLRWSMWGSLWLLLLLVILRFAT